MGTLAEKIAALRVKITDSHGDELYLATRLKADIAARDAELMSEIITILQDHENRRRDVAHALHLLAARVGQLPRIAAEPRVGHAAEEGGQPSLPDAGATHAPGGLNGVH